ncbi:hypothetical protein V1478_018765, partial [Vespula squamosa]
MKAESEESRHQVLMPSPCSRPYAQTTPRKNLAVYRESRVKHTLMGLPFTEESLTSFEYEGK